MTPETDRKIESYSERREVVDRMVAIVPMSPPCELDSLFLLARYVRDLEKRIADIDKLL